MVNNSDYSLQTAEAFLHVNWRWLLWLAYAASWTIALVAPVPNAEDLPFGEELFDFRMVFAKTVHVSAYAVFAVLTSGVGYLMILAGVLWLRFQNGAWRKIVLVDHG